MTLYKVKKICDIYIRKLAGNVPTRMTYLRGTEPGALQHIAWMCHEVIKFAGESPDKAQRWLGFIQGALWAKDIYPIIQLQEHNRMTRDDFPGHSLERHAACSGCGDIEGCHHWHEVAA